MFGLDLLDFFRRRYSWRKLDILLRRLRLSDRSELLQAQSDDPEYAEWVLSLPERPPSPPSLSEWTPDHDVLVKIEDRVGELIAAVIATGGGKWRSPPVARRPVTGVDRVKALRRRARHESLVDEVKAAQERWAATHDGG